MIFLRVTYWSSAALAGAVWCVAALAPSLLTFFFCTVASMALCWVGIRCGHEYLRRGGGIP